MGHRRHRQQEGLRAASRAGLSPGREDRNPQRIRHHAWIPTTCATSATRIPAVINQDYTPANSYQFVTTPGSGAGVAANGIPAPTFPDITVGHDQAVDHRVPFHLPAKHQHCDSFPKYMNRGYYQSWNFFVQREFSPTLTAQVGYVGTHAVAPDDGRQHQRLGARHRHRRTPALPVPADRHEPIPAIRQHDL